MKINPILLIGAVAWLISQLSKAIIHLIINKRFQWDRLFGDGGMPSSHSTTVTSVAVMTGLRCGWDSPIFAVAAIAVEVVIDGADGSLPVAPGASLAIRKAVFVPE